MKGENNKLGAAESESTRGPGRDVSATEAEYRHLVSFFKWLVGATLTAIVLVGGFGTYFLGKSVLDIKNEANAAIVGTKEAASQEISKIGTEAATIARTEAQKHIDEAFEKRNIQAMIERTAREKVGDAVAEEIARNLGARIRQFETEIGDIGEVANEGARLRIGLRPALDALVKSTASPNKIVSQYARSTLILIGSDYEITLNRKLPSGFDLKTYFGVETPKNLKEVLNLIRHSEDVNVVALAFMQMRRTTGAQMQVFDVPAAERWCAENRPKCE
jgi:hypothetical protein